MAEWDFPEHGCNLGQALAPTIPPWPLCWEQNVNDVCAHRWEVVIVTRMGGSREPVVRCAKCRVPRCGHWVDDDPCMERRHHDGLHITLSGVFKPVEGTLLTEGNDR